MKIKLKLTENSANNDEIGVMIDEVGTATMLIDDKLLEHNNTKEDEIMLESIKLNGVPNRTIMITASKSILNESKLKNNNKPLPKVQYKIKSKKSNLTNKISPIQAQSLLKQIVKRRGRPPKAKLPNDESVIRIKSSKPATTTTKIGANKSKPKTKLKSPPSSSNQSIPIDRHRNPFELVSCQQFDQDEQPFQVKIKCQVLAIMDLHAHSLKTEIIGCLGGHYCRITKTVHISVVEPCRSIDNHSMQCEIDPVSLIIATEKLSAQNYELVGWYHSHPNFCPEPSLRDIETQAYYQNQFTKDSGVEGRPFVGLIVTPYLKPDDKLIRNSGLNSKSFEKEIPVKPLNSKMFYANDKLYNCFDYTAYRYFKPELNKVLASTYKCFWISDDPTALSGMPADNNLIGNGANKFNSKLKKCQIPYEIDVEINRDEYLIPSISNKLSEMCEFILRDYPESIINHRARYINIGSISVTYLEKIIASLSHHLQHNPFLCSDHESDILRLQCVAILVKDLLK